MSGNRAVKACEHGAGRTESARTATGGSHRRKGWLSRKGTVALTDRTGCSQTPEYSSYFTAIVVNMKRKDL